MRLINWLFVISAALVHLWGRVHHCRGTHRATGDAGEAPAVRAGRNGETTHGRHHRHPAPRGLRVGRHRLSTPRASRRCSRRNDKEWAAVGASAAALVEAANLLMVGDRAVDGGMGDDVEGTRRCGHDGPQGDEAKDPKAILASGEALNASATTVTVSISATDREHQRGDTQMRKRMLRSRWSRRSGRRARWRPRRARRFGQGRRVPAGTQGRAISR